MSRLLLITAFVFALVGCDNGSKPPTQAGPKAVEVQTTTVSTVSAQ